MNYPTRMVLNICGSPEGWQSDLHQLDLYVRRERRAGREPFCGKPPTYAAILKARQRSSMENALWTS